MKNVSLFECVILFLLSIMYIYYQLASAKKVVRPRYYSTELGIKDKLAVAVITKSALLPDYGVMLNLTLSRYVNRLLFFVEGDESTPISGLPCITFPPSANANKLVTSWFNL